MENFFFCAVIDSLRHLLSFFLLVVGSIILGNIYNDIWYSVLILV